MPDTGTATAKGDPQIVNVNIICAPGTKPSVHPEPSHVSKNRKDIIRWQCDDDPDWKVDFGADSPFPTSTFDRAHDCSGPALDNAQEKKYYKYSVTAGGGTSDPGTIVDP